MFTYTFIGKYMRDIFISLRQVLSNRIEIKYIVIGIIFCFMIH